MTSRNWQESVAGESEFPRAGIGRLLAAHDVSDENGDFDLGVPWPGGFDPLDDDPE
jgi:hypothetical protein